jgi:hypothetical protein
MAAEDVLAAGMLVADVLVLADGVHHINVALFGPSLLMRKQKNLLTQKQKTKLFCCL